MKSTAAATFGRSSTASATKRSPATKPPGIDYATHDEINRRRAEVFTSEHVEGVERGGGSTWQSFRRGLPAIETDYLNGEIALLGLEHGVATPANRALQLLSKIALRERREVGQTTLDEILAIERALA